MKNSFPLRFLVIALSLSLFSPQIDAHEPVYARKGMVVAQEPVEGVDVSAADADGNDDFVFQDLACIRR